MATKEKNEEIIRITPYNKYINIVNFDDRCFGAIGNIRITADCKFEDDVMDLLHYHDLETVINIIHAIITLTKNSDNE